jgi:transcriptional regulator with XRE-family HTH domain
MRSFSDRTANRGRARAVVLGAWFGRELRIARTSAGLTQAQLGKLAGVTQQAVSHAELGRTDVSLDVRCRLVAACGFELNWRLYPIRTVRLRDSGQLHIAQSIVSAAHAAWQPQLEHIVAPGDLRAADILLSHPVEVVQVEIERSLVDFRAQLRSAQVKRHVIAQHEARPVRLILAVPDTSAVRERLAPHTDLVRRVLPVNSRRIWASLASGEPIGGDGLLVVRRDRLTSVTGL